MRYHGTFVTVPGRSIELFISAFKSNWSEYEQLKASLPGGGSYTKIGAQGMTINVGGYYDGVCIQSHYMPIKSQHRLTQVISSYQYAAKRAPEIKGFLAGL
jgi:hypothetical protein